jgi:hypothetical protein
MTFQTCIVLIQNTTQRHRIFYRSCWVIKLIDEIPGLISFLAHQIIRFAQLFFVLIL